MAKQKNNPLLAKYEAMLEEKYRTKLEINSEIDQIAFMLTIDDNLQVEPDQADKLLNDFLANKIEVAEAILEDSKADKELLHTKHSLATRLKGVLGERWEKWRGMFVLVKEYW
jgi:cell division FtsZ-interacting protein ZapD